MATTKALRKDYIDALDRGTAALFIGAGMSIEAGYPDWRTFLSEIAEELNLDITRESDLPGVAQYHLNKAKKTRTKLAQLVRDCFLKRTSVPDSHRILARLPIHYIWTTNYDGLIEQAWEQQSKKLDVKTVDLDLTTDDRLAHGLLYKMHGTAEKPTDVVIAKDDYEQYVRTRPGMLQRLGSDLAHKTFLFLGLSFTDPNLAHLLAMIRATFDQAPRMHYALVRRPHRKDNDYKGKGGNARFDYDSNRFELWTDDLQRYGIHVIAIDTYDDVPETLRSIERDYAQRNVFVSGSYPETGGDADKRVFVSDMSRAVGRVIARKSRNLVSGFGLVVGHSTVTGLLEEIYTLPQPNVERRLTVRPFPRTAPEGITVGEFQRRYREDMISSAGITIFIAGIKEDEPIAAGVLEEFQIAKSEKRVVIPIGCTGGAAAEIWKEVMNDFKTFFPKKVKKSTFKALGDEKSRASTVVRAVEKILGQLEA